LVYKSNLIKPDQNHTEKQLFFWGPKKSKDFSWSQEIFNFFVF